MEVWPGRTDSGHMRRKTQAAARDQLLDALTSLQRDGEPVVIRDGKRPVGVLITVEDFKKLFVGETSEIAALESDEPTYPQVDRRNGERRRGERRTEPKDPAPREGDPTGTLDVLRELRSLGISAERT